jgi:hypothetical protein
VALESADVDDQRRVADEAGMRHMLSIIDEGSGAAEAVTET